MERFRWVGEGRGNTIVGREEDVVLSGCITLAYEPDEYQSGATKYVKVMIVPSDHAIIVGASSWWILTRASIWFKEFCIADHDPTLVPDTQNEQSASEEIDAPYLVTVEYPTGCGFKYAQISMNVDVSNFDLEGEGFFAEINNRQEILVFMYWGDLDVFHGLHPCRIKV